MSDRIRQWLEDAREHWDDSYWHADHPEVKAALIAIVTGLIGLLFAWLEARLQQRYKLPEVNDV